MYSLAYTAISVPRPVTNSIHSMVRLSMYRLMSAWKLFHGPPPQLKFIQSHRCTTTGPASGPRLRYSFSTIAKQVPSDSTVTSAGSLLLVRSTASSVHSTAEMAGSSRIQPAQRSSGAATAFGITASASEP